MVTITIRSATTADIAPAAAVIGFDWHDRPDAEWLVGSELLRTTMLAATAAMWIEHALQHGHVAIVGDYAAIAVWFDRASGPAPVPGDYDSRVAADCGVHADRFRQFDAFSESHHPDFPHHHLAMLTVAPDRPRYLAAALLRQHHAELDSLHLPAVTRAHSPAQVSLYEEHGYRVLDRFCLGEDGPVLWSMCREPMV